MKFWTGRVAIIFFITFGAFTVDLIDLQIQAGFAAEEQIHSADPDAGWISPSDPWAALPRERKMKLPRAAHLMPWSEGLLLTAEIADRLLTPPPNLRFEDLHQFYAVCRI